MTVGRIGSWIVDFFTPLCAPIKSKVLFTEAAIFWNTAEL
ncbi:hypothetical protein ADIS_0030 [Lunatimonas lonarensis]|uniref:Uncharacterized protein n=1 Tax=Lunatimonas lonarensis TaxID=1232681 RepID=R7ZZI7_9BACT|nr:hypothetical protein ADIS_0030 [Lunatimonas lonarensis]